MFVYVRLEERKASFAAQLWHFLSGLTLFVIPAYSTGGIGIRYEIYKDLVLVKPYQYETSLREVRWMGLGLLSLLHVMPDRWTVAVTRILGERQWGGEDRFAEAVGMTFSLFMADAHRDGLLEVH